ncbi:MAG: HTH domain-containing protein [Bacteroidetes bacterium]|nr:HTH domain-containing protein [Bacteroidota bacterium]
MSGKIIEIIRGNMFATFPEMAISTGVTERTVYRNIQKLKAQGIIKRIGPDKGGYWMITEK